MTEPVATLRSVVREPTTWVVAGCCVAVVVLQWGAVGDRTGSLASAAFTTVGFAAFAAGAGLAAQRGRWVALGAMFLACSPATLTSVAAGERHGAVAVLAAAVVLVTALWHGPDDGVVATVAGAVALIGTALWWGSGVTRGNAPGPGWTEIVSSTGDDIRAGFGVVGVEGVFLPPSAHLLWWCGVGLLVGAVLAGGRAVALLPVLVVPAAVAAFVLVAWSITRWRGPVDAAGGMWIVAAAIAYCGASVGLAPGASRRIATAVVIVAGAAWAIGLVRLFRSADAATAWSVAAVAAVVAAVAGVERVVNAGARAR